MDWSQYKLAVGAMSKPVVSSCLKYSYNHNFPLMIIASRNQADYSGGYAFNTAELVEFVKNDKYYDKSRIKICRDHCGPNFSDSDKNLSLADSTNDCKKTIKSDIENGFDLIHIDVSRAQIEKQEQLATELIEYALALNPDISLEFGSEDNTGQNLSDTLKTVDKQIEFASNYKKNIKFLVNQTGSLVKHTQVGMFDKNLSNTIAQKIHSAGYLFKEHNADYLDISQVRERRENNIDSVNIAPQLGYLHTLILTKLGHYYGTELEKFKKDVLLNEQWKKWVVEETIDDEIKFLVSGHYLLGNESASLIRKIIEINRLPFDDLLYKEVEFALDQYRLGFGG